MHEIHKVEHAFSFMHDKKANFKMQKEDGRGVEIQNYVKSKQARFIFLAS